MFPFYFQFYLPVQTPSNFQQVIAPSDHHQGVNPVPIDSPLPQKRLSEVEMPVVQVNQPAHLQKREARLKKRQEREKENKRKIMRLERWRLVEELQKVQNRNVLPNNINLLLSYVRRSSKSGDRVRYIIERLRGDQQFTQKGFYAYQSYLMGRMDPHRTRNTLRELTTTIDPRSDIFPTKTQRFYNAVCRILLRGFIAQDYKIALLTSSKIHRTSKADHLIIRRYLQSELRHLLASPLEGQR